MERIIVYHGSPRKFNKLKIEKKLVRTESTNMNEGMGIYFSTDAEVARSYGKYLYTLELNGRYCRDMRSIESCRQYMIDIIRYIADNSGIYVVSFIDMDGIISDLADGYIAVDGLAREIGLHLDSNEQWHIRMGGKTDWVEKIINKFNKEYMKVYMFNYNIPNIGVIKDVSPEVVRIVNRMEIAF